MVLLKLEVGALMKKLTMATDIFISFMKIGCFTFGGGWGIVAQMQKEFVEKRGWITEEELIDYTSVGKSIPGTMIANVSYLFGYHMGGAVCGIAALLGITFIPLVLLTFITLFYNNVKDNIYIMKALVGIRAAVLPIIGSAIWHLRKAALKKKSGYVIALGSFLLYYIVNMQSFLIIILGAVLGLFLTKRGEGK